jgi:type IX secretion system PorP/SprF family membrane protein
MKNFIIFIFIVILNSFTVKSQDIYFSQFDKTPLILNPANTGYFNGGHRLGVSYRSQWKNITTPFTTTSAFYDTQFLKKQKKDRMGLGLVFLSDKSGEVQLGLTQISLSFAYSKLLSKENLFSFGFQAGYVQRSFDYNKARWDNQYIDYTYNSNFSSGETNYNSNYSYIDYAAGMTWGFRPNDNLRTSTGIALFHLSSPKSKFIGTSKEGLYRKLVVHNKTEIFVNKSAFSYEPAISYIRQGVDQQIIAGLMIKYTEGGSSFHHNSSTPKIFSLGAYFRTENALILAARLNYGSFEFNFSYDLNNSNLANVTNSQGGYELSFIFTQHSGSKKKGYRKGVPNLMD